MHSEHIVLNNLLCPITPLLQVFFQLSSLDIAYTNLGFISYYLILLPVISASCRPPSHQTVFWKMRYFPFLIKFTSLVMFLLFLVSLPLLAINTADFISTIIRGACYGTTYGSLFRNSFFSILKCARAIHVVNDALYLLWLLD